MGTVVFKEPWMMLLENMHDLTFDSKINCGVTFCSMSLPNSLDEINKLPANAWIAGDPIPYALSHSKNKQLLKLHKRNGNYSLRK